MNLSRKLLKTKEASVALSDLATREKNKILDHLARFIAADEEKILRENKRDVARAKKAGMNRAFLDRLTITKKGLADMCRQVKVVGKLGDPVGRIIEKRRLANGIELRKIGVPLGVIAVIYEARPNVTVDACSLAIKSGNSIVLKGGSEALNTNRVLAGCVASALEKSGVPKEAVCFLDTRDRRVVDELLECNKLVDVIIPRGGYELVTKVAENTAIPVLYHAEGGARIYVHKSADISMAVEIIKNAKVQRPGVCNALDTVVVDRAVARKFLTRLVSLKEFGSVDIRGDEEARKIITCRKAKAEDYRTEFLSLVLSIKTVENLNEALVFIGEHSKGHSEGIVAKDRSAIKSFVSMIPASAVFVNCSTRLHDGSCFELGAEMGIATGKLHARGPVGLKELTTYKWVAYGNGQVRI